MLFNRPHESLQALINTESLSASVVFILLPLPLVILLLKSCHKPRFVKLESSWESLLWTWRLMLWKFSFPERLEDWKHDEEVTMERMISVQHVWEFITPFFASRGYTLYRSDPFPGDLWPAPFPPVTKNVTYPYARQVPSYKPPRMGWGSPPTWGARDTLGRDVFLNTVLRSDPHNHTIYALEFLTFDNFVFVVMPRWDSAFGPEFDTVSELMSFSLTCFQTFAFLRRNRIVHGDFLTQNIGMNIVIEPTEKQRRTGMRDPKEVRYALYDFGSSIAYLEDAVIEETLTTRWLDFEGHFLLRDSIDGPYNPFKADIAFLGSSLQVIVRHLETDIPELGPFFDRLVDMKDPGQLTASQALTRFSEIYDGLSSDVLQKSFDTFFWIDGVITKKYEAPITIPESPAT